MRGRLRSVCNLGPKCRAAGWPGQVVVSCLEHWEGCLVGSSCRLRPLIKLAGSMMCLVEG